MSKNPTRGPLTNRYAKGGMCGYKKGGLVEGSAKEERTESRAEARAEGDIPSEESKQLRTGGDLSKHKVPRPSKMSMLLDSKK